MRATVPTDALVQVTLACICGSGLWPYNSMAPTASERGWVTSLSDSWKQSVPTCEQ